MTATEDEVVIGEGVVVDASAATVGLRAGGAIIDIIALGIVYLVSLWILAAGGLGWADGALAAAALVTHGVLVWLGIPVAVETLTRGRSLGKLAAGIRIVRDDGGPIVFRHAFTRALIGIIEIYALFGSVAFLTSLVAKRSKRVGDMFAGTYALRVRGVKRGTLNLYVPPTLEAWAAIADVRRLPDGVALSARQYLERAATLTPASRQHYGTLFRDQLTPYVAPAPPVGTHPDAFLMAVLAIRRNREYETEARHMQADAEQAKAVARLPFGVPDASD